MKKYLILTLLGIGSVINASAFSFSQTVASGTMTNLFPLTQGSAYVTSISVTAVSSNTSVVFYDTPTNSFTYVTLAYTNRVSYGTNYNITWTNFYGVTQTNPTPIIALIDVTNTVPQATNYYYSPAAISALAGTTANYPNLNSYYSKGIWVTNTSPWPAIVTITGKTGE